MLLSIFAVASLPWALFWRAYSTRNSPNAVLIPIQLATSSARYSRLSHPSSPTKSRWELTHDHQSNAERNSLSQAQSCCQSRKCLEGFCGKGWRRGGRMACSRPRAYPSTATRIAIPCPGLKPPVGMRWSLDEAVPDVKYHTHDGASSLPRAKMLGIVSDRVYVLYVRSLLKHPSFECRRNRDTVKHVTV